MIDDTLLEAEEKMDGAVEALRRDLNGVRSGRAHPSLIESMPVDSVRQRLAAAPALAGDGVFGGIEQTTRTKTLHATASHAIGTPKAVPAAMRAVPMAMPPRAVARSAISST